MNIEPPAIRRLPSALAASATATVPPAHDQHALGRVWLVANLATVGGVIALGWGQAPLPLLGGWALFVLLNVGLCLAVRASAGGRGREREQRETAVAAMLGLAWGAGVALLLPYTTVATQGALLTSAFAIALVALPVFADGRAAYPYFLSTLAVLTTAGLVHDGRQAALTLWVALGSAILLTIAAAYFHALEQLRAIVRRLLRVSAMGAAGSGLADSDRALAQQAERALDRLHLGLAQHARDQRVLHALGGALLVTDGEGRVDYINAVAETMLGRRPTELYGQRIEDCLRLVVAPAAFTMARALFEQVRSSRHAQFSSDEAQLLRADGVLYGIDYVVTPIIDERGTFTGASFTLRDVTSRRQRTDRIAWQATHDALTGTLNRAEFERRLIQLLACDPITRGPACTLLFIDIDKFKFINDSYGHAAGDYVLRALAEVLRQQMRGADTLARLGGDEFCALLQACNADKARLLAEGLRTAVERYDFRWHEVALPVSLSVGVVAVGADARSSSDLLHAADSACYTAKQFGRNRVELIEQGADDSQRHALSIKRVQEIQSALHEQRLDLFYQPLCATATAHPSTRCEINVGIRGAEDRVLPHQEVIELAARFRLSAAIDRWAVKATLDALRLQHPAFDGMATVFMPLSAQALTDDNVLEFVIRMVREQRELAGRLGFTIPAIALAADAEFVRYFIATLKQDGCQFMVSDLGFGGGAIDLIKSMQIDYLGIGASFVSNMLASSVDYEVVLGLSRVARALGMHAVADQADSLPVREALAQMGVEFAKGRLRDGPRRVRQYDAAGWDT